RAEPGRRGRRRDRGPGRGPRGAARARGPAPDPRRREPARSRRSRSREVEMSVVARGHVSDRPVARSVYWIAAKRFTGDLILSQDDQEYRLTWHQGAVIGARSASPADSEGRVALTAGLVTSTQLGEVLRRVSESPGRDQLDALVEVA